MPFDTLKAKKIINSLKAHSRLPGGEVMEQAADCLNDALQDAMGAMQQVRGAEAEAAKAKGQYEDALLEIKKLRDIAQLGEKAISVLQEVAATKKGAAAKAHAWLASVGKLPPEPVNPMNTPATPPAAEAKK